MGDRILRHVQSKSHHAHHMDAQVHLTPSTEAWVLASVAMLSISATGLLGVCLVPLLERKVFKRLLNALVALAVGSLCGDALIHLIPHALGVVDFESAAALGSLAFFFIIAFFIFEAFILWLHTRKREKKRRMSAADPSRSSSIDAQLAYVEEGHAVAWMVISGDGLHNLTDGLAVGAAFRVNTVAGFATSLAIFTHEIPHELGDFAVLLKAGMTFKEALFYNLLSSLMGIFGMVAGVLLGNISAAESWIYCFTAGSFLYIGLANLVPELHKYRSKEEGCLSLLVQVLGMSTGGGVMLLIALFEHNLDKLFNQS